VAKVNRSTSYISFRRADSTNAFELYNFLVLPTLCNLEESSEISISAIRWR
jgi:hypothetical protein